MLKGLAVSNIAWPHQDFECALDLSRLLGLGGIEIAPYNVFRSWDVEDADVRALASRITDAGLVCPAMQGILFNAPGAALFDSDESRQALARHLEKVARIAGLLGATACVFGAPRQRDPGGLPPEAAFEIAVEFLKSIGPIFAAQGTSLAFEANARVYDCRFITTTAEAIDLVAAVDTPGISLQIDMGTLILEDEDPSILHSAAPFAAHAHVSEPQLRPIGSTDLDHRPFASALRESGYSGFLSIEMRMVEDWQSALRTAVDLVRNTYL